MKKVFFLFLFLGSLINMQATTYYYQGTNQINNLMEKLVDKDDIPLFTLDTSDSKNEKWEDIPGLSWEQGDYPAYVDPTDDDVEFNYLTEIDWAGFSYTQQAGEDIVLKHALEEVNDLRMLEKINFSGNNFRDITMEGLPALAEVDLSANPTLEALTITGCPELEKLDITGSSLSFATINNIQSNVTLKSASGFNYQLQGQIERRVNAVDLTDILTENGTSVDSWSVAPVSSTGDIYVFNNAEVGNTVTCTLKNSNYPGLSVKYEVKLLEENAVSFVLNGAKGSTVEVETLPATIGQTVTININIKDLYQLSSFSINGTERKGDLTPTAGGYTMDLDLVAGVYDYTLVTDVSGFSGEGSGTPDIPYRITNMEQLAQIRNNPSACYILENNIALTLAGEGWSPIPDFFGVLDGNGHVITGLWIDADNDNTGLIGIARLGAEIKNLGVIIENGKSVKGGDNVGGIVGILYTGKVSGCFVKGSLEGNDNVAGIVGTTTGEATIENCYAVEGTISGEDRIAGILGRVENGVTSVVNCYAMNDINGGEGKSGAGIVAAFDAGTLNITNCVALNARIDAPKGQDGENTFLFAARIMGYPILGLDAADVTCTNNYAFENILLNSETTEGGVDDKRNGESKTAKELLTTTTYYTGWDFTNTWAKGSGNYPLPVLKAFDAVIQDYGYPAHLNYVVNVEVAVAPTSVGTGTVSLSEDQEVTSMTVFSGAGVTLYFAPEQGFEVISLMSGEEYIAKDITEDSYKLETVLDDYTGDKIIYVTFSDVLSTINKQPNVSFTVYPNPVQDRLIIDGKADGSLVSVYNMMGTTVMASTASELDFSSLAAGVYFVEVDGTTVKVIKK